ncbi:MAG TPA: Rieske 2Fe-2S domain-containing protein [Polyangiaceae bacterium]|jgi:Rieske Fe-S protein
MNHGESRRRFLRVLAGSTVVGVAGCGSAGVGPAPIGDVPAGNVSDLPVDTLRPLGNGIPGAIGRDAGGVYALTLTCSHAGCNMATDGTVSFAGMDCSCHGSHFDNNGDVTGGPAPDPLQHFAVEIDSAGMMTVHGGQYVSPSVRTLVA